MNLYPKFYLLTGVRLAKKLKDPRVNLLKNFEFPKNSFFHYTELNSSNDSGYSLGITSDNPFLANLPAQSKPVLFHQTDYSENIDLTGIKLVRKTLQKGLLVKQYHRENPNFIRGFIDTSKAKLITNVCVKNHTLVGAEYHYTKTVLSEYIRFKNYWKSVFTDIAKMAINGERHHFVAIKLPDVIPARSILNKWENESKQTNWKKFNTEERFLFAEFYAWLKQDAESVFPTEPKALKKINIIFYHKYFYYVVNLGLLNDWIIPDIGKTEDGQVMTTSDARRFFILGAMKVVMNTVVATNNEADESEEDQEDAIDQSMVNDDDFEGNENEELLAKRIKDVATDYSVSNQEDVFEAAKSKSLNLNPKNFSNVGSKSTVGTIEELLKIGTEKGAVRKLSAKEQKVADAAIFNSEETTDEADELDLETLELLNKEEDIQEEKKEILKTVGYQSYQSENLDLTSFIEKRVDSLSTSGKYSTAELRRLKMIGKKWEDIPDVNGKFKNAVEKVNIKPVDLQMPTEVQIAKDVPGVLDKSMLYSSLATFDKQYIDEILPRHILACAVNLQKADICVTDHKVLSVENAFDAYDIHSFKLIPLEGLESTIKLPLPKVQKDGSFMVSGVKSKSRKQKIDLPIRKISFNQVALTSYVSKFFVTRSDKSAYSQERWLEKELIGISNEQPNVQISFADCYKYDTMAPIKFTILSRLISKVVIGDYSFNFDIEKMNSIYGKELVDTIKDSKKNQIVVGKNLKKNSILIMAEDGTIFECATDKLNDFHNLGTFEKIMGMDISKAPTDMLEVNISGKTLPFVFVLGYYLGLGNLLKTINAQFDRYPKGTRVTIEDNQFAVRFKDETLVFDKDDYLSQIVVGGFKQLHNEIKNYSVYDFDLPDVYGAVLLDRKISARYGKELDLMRALWVDPITKNVLDEMGEPTDFVDLLLSAAAKLTIDKHDLGRDEKGFRIRGYERFAGFAYMEMVKAVRIHLNKPNKSNSRVELNPQAVKMTILQDQTTTPVEDSNPIHSLKEQEVVVYRGLGGRDGRTLNSESRKYHPNSVGIMSDATVDNGDAGTVTFLTADPKFKSLLGTTEVTNEKDQKNLTPTQLMNTSSLLAPAIEFDDGKRRNFASIQNSRTTNCLGLTLLPVRTGYENVLAYRVSDLYVVMAEEDGVVTEITKNAIVVKYVKSGEQRFMLGKRFGKWQGKVVPHDLITELKVGDKFKSGEPITYNPAFFQYNWVAGTISYKMGVLTTVALVENNDTIEDSSAMSAKHAAKMSTKIIENVDVLVEFDQEIENLIKVGTAVEYDTTICNLMDTLSTASADKFFTGESRELLSDINSLNKKAETKGTVVAIEATYCGEPDNMTESLRTVVEKLDREKSQAFKDQGKPRVDGSVKPGFRMDGTVFTLNTCIIRVRIEVIQEMRNGSKSVASHQMKSVTGRVWDKPYETESGRQVDEFFGYQSLQNRIVNSPEIIGGVGNLMVACSKSVVKIFRGNK